MTTNTTTNIIRNSTTADAHRDRILEFLAANGAAPITGRVMGQRLGISAVHYRRLKDQLVAAGRLIQVTTLTGPGGGTVYAVPAREVA